MTSSWRHFRKVVWNRLPTSTHEEIAAVEFQLNFENLTAKLRQHFQCSVQVDVAECGWSEECRAMHLYAVDAEMSCNVDNTLHEVNSQTAASVELTTSWWALHVHLGHLVTAQMKHAQRLHVLLASSHALHASSHHHTVRHTASAHKLIHGLDVV